MKKKVLLGIASLLGICSILGSSFLVGAENQTTESAMKWCNGDNETSIMGYYDEFATNYTLNAWDKNGMGPQGDCSSNGETISCTYSLNNKGMYNLAVDSDNGSQYVTPDNNGNIKFTVTAQPGSEVAIYSYPNKPTVSSCKTDTNGDIGKSDSNRENYISVMGFSLPMSKKNNFYNSTMCKNFRNTTGKSNYSNYASSNVPECFDKESDINILTTEYEIQTRINQTNSYVKNLNLKSDKKSGTSKLYCQFDTSKNQNASSKNTTAQIKSYTKVEDIKDGKGNIWYKVSCTEDMTIGYDKPKASYTSGGFKYTVRLNSKQSCEIIPVRQPVKPTVCRPSFYFSDTNSQFGGPNDDFDQCIESCDGGAYSNTCSDKCYSEIYEQGKTIDQVSFINNNLSSSFNNVEKMLYTPSTKNNQAWCSTQENVPSGRANSISTRNGQWHWQVCPSRATIKGGQTEPINNATLTGSEHGIGNIASNKNGDVYGCVYGWQSNNNCHGKMICNNNCSDNSVETEGQANEKYEQEKRLQESAKKTMLNTYKNCKETGNNTFSCQNQETTKTATENATITRTVKNKGNDLADNKGEVHFSGTTKPDTSYDSNDAYINFPKAFINLENGKITYSNQNSTTKSGHVFGGYLFYTDPNTKASDTNNIRYYPEYASSFGIKEGIIKTTGLKPGSKYGKDGSLTIDWNIVTQIRNFGSYKQWDIDVNCFYGADVSKCGDDPNEPCDSDPSCPTGKNCDTIPECKGGNCIGGNLPYRYRAVNLNDLFPDREAGYNWQENNANKNASTSNYKIDPTTLIKDVETKGNSIYNRSAYNTLAIGKNGLNWRDLRNSGLYTEFDGGYSASQKGLSFYNSSYVGNHQKSNRTN